VQQEQTKETRKDENLTYPKLILINLS